MPPNASKIVAIVLDQSSGVAGSPGPVLRLQVRASRPEDPSLESFATPGSILTAVSSDAIVSDLTGRTIEAAVKLSSDLRGVQWWISNLRVLP